MRQAEIVTRPYLVRWSADGSMYQAFRDEGTAIKYANLILPTVYAATHITMTGPDHEYISCECGCGRVMRDGDGQRVGREVLHPECYAKHPVIVGATMAEIDADERQDIYERARR
jgi:hypothetical protein